MVKILLAALCGCLCWAAVAFAGVDINRATARELTSLHGIGPVKAEAIVEYRQKNGRFNSKKDLLKVKGIGPKLMEKLGSEITITQ
ncbi:MAG: helix-hairpin-helix domain-containing protein [Desulfobulbaceae bacterium]|nr:helix-hairpin-helix domain-containing protein [Desulfobulbaceae bacterium]HIJ91374.1 helix-hairpin-helix domain-containing protein [Deltaproteobacteria bacterium]